MVSIAEQRPLPTIRIENGQALIAVPLDEVHGLRVVLAGCPCRAAKSLATDDLRQRLDRALARFQERR